MQMKSRGVRLNLFICSLLTLALAGSEKVVQQENKLDSLGAVSIDENKAARVGFDAEESRIAVQVQIMEEKRAADEALADGQMNTNTNVTLSAPSCAASYSSSSDSETAPSEQVAHELPECSMTQLAQIVPTVLLQEVLFPRQILCLQICVPCLKRSLMIWNF